MIVGNMAAQFIPAPVNPPVPSPVYTPVSTCGNRIVEGFETCDDGNKVSWDGCSSSCKAESAGTCGNGRIDAKEECDWRDPNPAFSNSQLCLMLTGKKGNAFCSQSCTFDLSGCKAAPPTCGNGKSDRGEECDPATKYSHTMDCGTRQTGMKTCNANCTWNKSECRNSCGNGKTDRGETCDPTDPVNNTNTACGAHKSGVKTCTNDCRGWDSSTCVKNCGNGKIDYDEKCDDGNSKDGDCCSADCRYIPNRCRK